MRLKLGIMKMSPAILSCVWLAVGLSALAEEDWEQRTIQAGNAWTNGAPIPPRLLKYASSWREGSCFPDPWGTDQMFGSITNFPLLWKIALLPTVDARVYSNAIANAIWTAGPGRFFAQLSTALKDKPELENQESMQVMIKQSKVRHMVLDSLYISYSDMPPAEGRKVLEQIKDELQRGGNWQEIYRKFADRYEVPYEQELSGGARIKGTRTKIGNLGDFLLAENGSPLVAYREEWMPKTHIPELFKAGRDAMLILFDKEDLSRFADMPKEDTGERLVLYRVREVYVGK